MKKKEAMSSFKSKEKKMKCKYCGKIVEQIGKCGVCKDCCVTMISVCSKSRECDIGRKVWREIFEKKITEA